MYITNPNNHLPVTTANHPTKFTSQYQLAAGNCDCSTYRLTCLLPQFRAPSQKVRSTPNVVTAELIGAVCRHGAPRVNSSHTNPFLNLSNGQLHRPTATVDIVVHHGARSSLPPVLPFAFHLPCPIPCCHGFPLAHGGRRHAKLLFSIMAGGVAKKKKQQLPAVIQSSRSPKVKNILTTY